MFRTRAPSAAQAFLCASVLFAATALAAPGEASDISGVRVPTTSGVTHTSADLMQLEASRPPRRGPRPEHELEGPERDDLLPNPAAPAISRYPSTSTSGPDRGPRAIHTPSTSFDGATLTDTGAFPPDSMGTVGPSQYVVAVNGRIRSFTKAGVADGVLNLDTDAFFASVMTPVGGSVVLNFTSDPQVRYDRFSARWFLSIIDVPCTNATCTATAANRWLLAVSDAASNGVISGSTVWTFFFVTTDPGTNFCDYPSLGIDVNALYFGCNMFSSAGSFVGTNAYVVQKASAIGAGPLVVTSFPNVGTGTGGPYAPRGVDNFDATATEGYFVGVDTAVFSRLVFRRVTNPGSATPTISANINLTVPTTGATNPVEHAGNTGGNNGRLDSLDDRLYAAMIRNGHLWTTHNLRVSTTGVASTATTARKAARWYDIQNLTTTPTLVQSGTVYDNAATLAAALQYWIPSITATGQGHAVIGFSLAGTPSGATPAYAGRLAGDTLGVMTGPPTAAAVQYGLTSANYNPPSDPGGTSGRRWGDYSFTVVDPLDDMSVWTIQEYNQALNSYAVRIGKLLAPPPATPTCSGSPISFAGGTGNVTINATSSGGSGFYDPGANLPAPARPFSHIAATVTNATVNSVTYNSPTQVVLNITANTAGLQNVTITNPDGQQVTANGCINVSAVTHTVTPSVSGGNGTISPSTPQTVNHGATTAFTLTPNAGYHIVTPVGGTCGGSLAGNTYTTNAVNADCTVIASFAINTYTVTPSVSGGNGTISPSTPQTVNHGATSVFTLTPNAGYHAVTPVGGTCGGSLVGNTYTTNAVTADCTVIASFAIDTHVVTPSVSGGNGTISPSTPQTVNDGATTAFTLTPNAGYHIVTPVGGTCGGSLVGNTYTTNAVTADCTVIASFAIDTHVVTPSVSGGNGTISPSTPQTVNDGATIAFTLTPNAGYSIVTPGGTCGGTLVGNTYTTNAVTADCTVIASFAQVTHVVAPSVSGGNGTISPSTPQTVNDGATIAFTLTPNVGYHIVTPVGGTCGGALVGNTYTTSAVTADCTVIASFAINTYTVTPSVSGGNGTISPSTPQTVNHGATTSFTLTPNANFHVANVAGTCGGNLVGNTYTTNAVTADCTVIASFAIDTHVVTPSVSGGNGAIAPSTPQTVNHGATTSFTLTPNANYHIGSVTGTCGGNLAGNVYTTNAVTADCTVIASFAIDTHVVSPSVSGGNGAIAPSTPQTVNHGATTSFTLTPNANYHVASVTGTCGGNLAGNTYTTNAVTADCTVIASFAIDTHVVTPSVSGGNGAIAPSTPQTVNHGATTSFTLTPAANYHIGTVAGTCGGSLAGNVYTTNAVNADCTVIASFAIDTHTVTPSVSGGNGAIAPSTPQTVNHGATTSFTLTPAANYHIGTVAGTCGGSLAGNVYTTNAVNADCTVIASFAIDTHVVTPSVSGGNGAIAPSTPQTVNHGATTSFTLTPAANYHIGTVAGTCGGSLAGNVYTTNAVNADC
ncbi:beta strand repeat-containing protein, partial [Dokdonella fugitiva]